MRTKEITKGWVPAICPKCGTIFLINDKTGMYNDSVPEIKCKKCEKVKRKVK